ncbi:MAG: 3-deoxy-D-manno-octulosonic acid kinase [Gammaproteobacteria bacterium]|nr:3-deoxy-D-manno-octulosonic acid kinase [Gammaproteobacteria bacterium]
MNMKEFEIKKLNKRWLLFDPALMKNPCEEYFSCAAMKQKNALTGSAGGRGETCFYRAENSIWALRHYLRGGLVAKLLSDQYFGLRLKNTRAWKEWHLLRQMVALRLPVPRPVAASVSKTFLFYRADLLTEYIEQTKTLAEILQADALPAELWHNIGHCIRQFHDNKVYHSDLNAKNIMLDQQQKVYLIDFDQCEFRSRDNWKIKNLLRLKRSLDKFQHKLKVFNFNEQAWQDLLAGYDGKA